MKHFTNMREIVILLDHGNLTMSISIAEATSKTRRQGNQKYGFARAVDILSMMR